METVKSAVLAVAIFALMALAQTSRAGAAAAYGIASLVPPKAYLNMPRSARGKMPALLSQTGAFTDLRTMAPAPGLIPYDVILPFWSDGAAKVRYIALPKGRQIGFTPDGEWTFPAGTVFVKTFELPTDEAHPQIKRRLETRLIVRDDKGGVYGVDYKWRPDNSDADLLASSLTENIAIRRADGIFASSPVLPEPRELPHLPQLPYQRRTGPENATANRTITYPSGVSDNELRTLNHLHLL